MKESHIHGHCEYPSESPSPGVVFSWAPVQIARETTGGATELSLQEELPREMQVVGRVLLLPLRVCCSLHTKAMQWATDLGKSCSTHDSSAGQFLLKIFPLARPRLSEPLFSLRPLLLSNPYFPLSFHRCQPYITFWRASLPIPAPFPLCPPQAFPLICLLTHLIPFWCLFLRHLKPTWSV